MMGELPANQNQLFYDFNLDELVPTDHLLKSIDRFLDFSDIKNLLADYYSTTGRPSVDPELMIRMLLVGYCYGIRSERRLCEEVRFNLAYRWFCRLGLDSDVPNHSTFSKNRLGRFRDASVFKEVFHAIVSCCIDEGLVKGEGFAIDGSQVGNQRRYQSKHLNTLRFILHSRELGFTLDYIRELMTLARSDEGKEHKADKIASKHLKEIELKITRLVALKAELSTMLKGCEHGQADSCRVIEVLSDHTLCGGDHESKS